jgi:peptidoglycan/xylan/chitin deacetylase (PgdA/CDA1 family)
MSATRPKATLSLDLDNQWAYQRVHGDAGWETFPSFLDRAVPRLLEVLADRGLAITVFVVGQDAALDMNHEALARIRGAGHDIENHSFHHLPSFAAGTDGEIEREVAMAEEAIERATGVRPRGFRGPGFSVSKTLLRVLRRRGYGYDASTFPTFLGPLARAYYRATVEDGAGGAEERRNLYGGWRDVLRPQNPYVWELPEGRLPEIPVTTFPFLRLPFHVTYILYLYQHARRLALGYLRSALSACRLSRTMPSVLLHALDFLGRDDVPELAFFPGMGLSGSQKTEVVSEVLDLLCASFAPMTMQRYLQSMGEASATLPSKTL